MTDAASFAAALRHHSSPAPAGLVTWNGSDPAQRFAVYRNNVAVALIDALAASFPVTEALCGTRFFRDMARQFALDAPPASPLLAEFGQDFPVFIAGHAPARSVPYLADVARLEAARVRVWHAADARPLMPDSFAPLHERIGQAILTLHPAHAVLSASFAIVSIWAAHNGVGELATVDVNTPEEALVVRPGLDTEIWRLPPGGAVFIQHLDEGQCVSDAAFATLASVPAFDPSSTFALVIRAGLVIAASQGTSR